MLFEMTHFTDLCNWFLAAEPEEVVALATGMLSHSILNFLYQFHVVG
jgi:hypothetical protein